ncbi:MAG: NTP transferase domain-containing protein [Candidatus Paceibacterota bacterium]|jgi:bifunctional UDP-N-acetylglucosamine pyrophosphorylase/glucosamine-1-phosphate N-acetyltransferase
MNVVVLAAGEGKRMAADGMPKVLVPLKGKPLISYVLEAIRASGADAHPTLVIGVHAELVEKTLGTQYNYVIQAERLGTGHAVQCAQALLEPEADDVLVLYGDHPLVSAKMIKDLVRAHKSGNNTLTMATTTVPDFKDWYAGFYDFGRIIRAEDGTLEKIIEKKDATTEELEIKEVNPGYYCFKSAWLWPALKSIKNDNAQKEYYLTDLLALAVKDEEKIGSVEIDPEEALGVNTREQLALVETLL